MAMQPPHATAFAETSLQSCTDNLGVRLGAEGLGTLDWRANGTVNDELGQDTESTRNTEEHGVVVLLGETIVLQQDTRVGVDVGVWVLGLSVLGEDAGGDLVDLADELEHWVVGKMLLRKFTLGDVAGIGLAEDGVAVTGDDLAGLEGGPEVLLDLLVAKIGTD
jgi:hypothetical protein